jgi:xylan 1,4-beta-xylosidase
VALALAGLPAPNGTATLTQYRIDAEHSNAYTVWQKMGSPSAPNDRQYEQLLKAGQLTELGQPETVSVNDGSATVKLNLPRQAVALLVMDWK